MLSSPDENPPADAPEAIPAVRVRALTERFGHFTAVDAVDLDVARGEVFGFLGPNGSGKTTMIRMLTGSIAATSGTIEVLGEDVLAHPGRIAQRIGYMSQRFSLFTDLTVEENLRFYAGAYDTAPEEFAARRDAVLASADLIGHERTLAGDLSVGLRQRLALGAATLHEPELLFLDEPTSGVDPVARRVFWDLIADLADRGITVFVTTHYMEEASNCTRLALMYRGHIIADDAPSRLRTGLLAGRVAEVSVADPEAAVTWLEATPEVDEVYAVGDRLHVVLTAAEHVDRLRETLAEGGHEARIEPVEPTLEDVFVTLIARQRRESGGDDA